MTFSINDRVVLVTGANGGLGTEFVRQFLERGATKIYAAARQPREWSDPRVVPLELDVTETRSITAAIEAAPDVDVLVNNAGVTFRDDLLHQSEERIRLTFETNFFGPVNLIRAFSPHLIKRETAAIIDVHSVMSWWAVGGSYSASKAALWSATNTFRLELQPHGVHVLGLHLSYTDTPMTKGLNKEMASADDVVTQALSGLEKGEYEVTTDDETRWAKGKLSGPIHLMYPQLTNP